MYISSHRSNVTNLSITLVYATTTVAAAVTAAAVVYAAHVNRKSSTKMSTATVLQKTMRELWCQATQIMVKQLHHVLLVLDGTSTVSTAGAPMEEDGTMMVMPIGVVRSIYRLCVGTPRQGLLAPQARGRIELTCDNANDMVDGLEGFSHIWIVFWFHLNTKSTTKTSTTRSSNSKSNSNAAPTKIAPPTLGGKKVGVLATRSPHRSNPIGITLCKLDSTMTIGGAKGKGQAKSGQRVILNISGLDLVDGTPVLDIKPYVPNYDSIGDEESRLPPWVSGGLETKRPVQISSVAKQNLFDILTQDPFSLDFYGPHRGDGCIMDTATRVQQCIEQVLAMDVRSAWQTSKARSGKSQAERAQRVRSAMGAESSASYATVATVSSQGSGTDTHMCSQQLDNLLIHYSVDPPEATTRTTSEGSGAEDSVTVHSLKLILKPRTTNREEQQAARQAEVSSPAYNSPQSRMVATPFNKTPLPKIDRDAAASVVVVNTPSLSPSRRRDLPVPRDLGLMQSCLVVDESDAKESPQSNADSMPESDTDDMVIVH